MVSSCHALFACGTDLSFNLLEEHLLLDRFWFCCFWYISASSLVLLVKHASSLLSHFYSLFTEIEISLFCWYELLTLLGKARIVSEQSIRTYVVFVRLLCWWGWGQHWGSLVLCCCGVGYLCRWGWGSSFPPGHTELLLRRLKHHAQLQSEGWSYMFCLLYVIFVGPLCWWG